MVLVGDEITRGSDRTRQDRATGAGSTVQWKELCWRCAETGVEVKVGGTKLRGEVR